MDSSSLLHLLTNIFWRSVRIDPGLKQPAFDYMIGCTWETWSDDGWLEGTVDGYKKLTFLQWVVGLHPWTPSMPPPFVAIRPQMENRQMQLYLYHVSKHNALDKVPTSTRDRTDLDCPAQTKPPLPEILTSGPMSLLAIPDRLLYALLKLFAEDVNAKLEYDVLEFTDNEPLRVLDQGSVTQEIIHKYLELTSATVNDSIAKIGEIQAISVTMYIRHIPAYNALLLKHNKEKKYAVIDAERKQIHDAHMKRYNKMKGRAVLIEKRVAQYFHDTTKNFLSGTNHAIQ